MNGTPGHANLALSCAFVDELAARGVRHAIVCPGSRSTPLALALATHPDVRIWVLVDERSAAFFALGMARQLREPVALLCTSGTAAANFLPAVIEAGLSRIPLIVLTADRPPELRGWGAAQTIDQIRLYGDHAKWFADMPVPIDDDALSRQARAAAARAVLSASDDPCGPVHLNFPFREPLLPADLRSGMSMDALFRLGHGGARGGFASSAISAPEAAMVHRLVDLVASEPRGIIVCGPGETVGLGEAVAALSEAAGYPVLADPLSGVRFGSRDRSWVIDAYDAFLRHEETAAELAPDVVLRVGAVPTSKPLQQFLAAHPGRHHLLVDPGDPRDPAHLATDHLRADPAATLAEIADRLAAADRAGLSSSSWLETWQRADSITRSVIDAALAHDDAPFEGRAVVEIAAALPDGATLVVGNGMPVRDVDTFVRGDARGVRIVGNRGANGIDGVVSSALGAAAVAPGPVVLIVGDLSFYHDLNGFLAARQYGIDATVVVLNNDGGGIFSFLPQAELLDSAVFEQLFGTPIGVDVAAAARLYGASYTRPRDWDTFRCEVRRAMAEAGLSIVEHVTDRAQNVVQHRAVAGAVADALRSAIAAMV
jgi:2-succinyl-5-enolpyruvyl-6-hydroxy-3-cyclohexene-1-carboxylate synthase